MSKSNAFENAFLLLMFNNVDFAGIGDAGGIRGSVSPGSFYIGLHTADPGEAGGPATNECAFGGYSRTAVARTAGAWEVTGNQVENVADISGPLCSSGAEDVTHFSVVSAASGGTLLYKSTLKDGAGDDTTFSVSAGVRLVIPAGGLLITED